MVTTKDHNDVDYLIDLITPILRTLKINKHAWCILISTVQCAAGDTTLLFPTADVAAENSVREAEWYIVADIARTVSMKAAWNAEKYGVWLAAIYAAMRAVRIACYNLLAPIQWDDQGFIESKKSYQIIECLTLLSLDRKLCRKIQDIAKDFPDCEIPEEKLRLLKDNLWIKQYTGLFHN